MRYSSIIANILKKSLHIFMKQYNPEDILKACELVWQNAKIM